MAIRNGRRIGRRGSEPRGEDGTDQGDRGQPVSAVIESSGMLIQCGRWRASYITS